MFCISILCDEKRLHKACGEGNISKVRRLLSTHMLNVNCVLKKAFYETTPLFEGALSGNSGVVLLLLDNGAKPNIPCTYGGIDYWTSQTPLHRAAAKGHISIVQHLIDRGADLDMADEDGVTPLNNAAW